MSTHNKPLAILKKTKLSKICSYGIYTKGLQNEFETAVVNEPSVFEPLKFNCNSPIRVIEILLKKKKKKKTHKNASQQSVNNCWP